MKAYCHEHVTGCHSLILSHRLWDSQLLSVTNQLIPEIIRVFLGTNCPHISSKDSENG